MQMFNIRGQLTKTIFFIITHTSLCTRTSTPADQSYFLQTYSPPPKIYLQIQYFLKSKDTFFYFSSNFIIKKYDINRLINAIHLKELIKRKNLTNINVATKYLYQKDNIIFIIAEKIEKNASKKWSLEDVQQLAVMVEETGFADWNNGENIITDKSGTIIFIDTENKSFCNSLENIPKQKTWTSKKKAAFELCKLKCLMTPEAQKWANEYLKKTLHANENMLIKPICINNALDPEELDLESIKRTPLKFSLYTN